MTFPTIPTSGNGRINATQQADTTATRSTPDISTITRNNGELLIAVIVAYQTSTGTNAAFSGWTDGFTEFHDSATSTTMAIGCAYKFADGTESGVISATQAGTITGHAICHIMSIAGAHASTPPEAGSRASGTTTAANSASFSPSWGAEDTLWIGVGGSGEDSTAGTFDGITGGTPPTNYSSSWESGITADAVGGVEAQIVCRQLNAASEDMGTFTVDLSSARNAAMIIAVRPAAAVPGFPQFQTILHPPQAVVASTVW